MDEVLNGGAGAVFLFLYLFLGFLGSLVYDFLVEGRKRDNLERIVAALVLTLLSSVALKVVLSIPVLPVTLDKDASLARVIDAFVGRNLFYGSLLAVGIAGALAVLNNTGATYWALQRLRITTKASSVDVWADMFDRFRGYWIRVRFTDGRSLVGWPQYYSQFGDPREVFLANAVWWAADATGAIVSTDVAGPGVYLADFSVVAAIEILK
jgi:hypothetical protein